ncbi:MAG: hypothetical protein HQL03_03730 [Nitrospirae bacterium]|nr:hypothetical protein [Nitrospirota bacterium]MBF0591777.1 hypothetical protein [Nitrospirota bacterium]
MAKGVEIFLESITGVIVGEILGDNYTNLITFSMSSPSFGQGDVSKTITLKLENNKTTGEDTQYTKNSSKLSKDEKSFFELPIFKEKIEGSAIEIKVDITEQVKVSAVEKFLVGLLKDVATAGLGALTKGISNVFITTLLSAIGADSAKMIQIGDTKVSKVASGKVSLDAAIFGTTPAIPPIQLTAPDKILAYDNTVSDSTNPVAFVSINNDDERDRLLHSDFADNKKIRVAKDAKNGIITLSVKVYNL